MIKKDVLPQILVPIVAASISGIVVYFISPNWQEKAEEKGWISKIEWQQEARRKGWIPEKECPANPLKIGLVGPGKNTSLSTWRKYSYSSARYLNVDLVYKLSSKISVDSNITFGLVLRHMDSEDLYVQFPTPDFNRNRDVVRFKDVYIPFEVQNGMEFEVRAIAVSDKEAIASRYIKFSDIETLDHLLSFSLPVKYKLLVEG